MTAILFMFNYLSDILFPFPAIFEQLAKATLGSINVYPMEVYMLNGLVNYGQGIPLISD